MSHVVFVTPELSPLAKVGGLADVAGSLPRALKRLGIRTSVLLPLYGSIDRERYRLRRERTEVEVDFDGRTRRIAIWSTRLHGIPVYLLNSEEYFSGRSVYGDDGEDYADNAFRFAFFSRACLEAIRALELEPDVLHVHDWPTALLPLYARIAGGMRTPVVLTVHNLAYQGVFPPEWLPRLGIPGNFLNVEGLEFYGRINFLKGGLALADAINTVSPTYAREIRTPELGAGLDGVMRHREKDLYGILNGIEPSDWNPTKDEALAAPFSSTRLEGKAKNKLALQAELGLEVASRAPLLGVVGRLDPQKGFDVLVEAAPFLLRRGFQLAVLGSGDPGLLRAFQGLASAHPRSVAAETGFQDELGRRIYAGSDLFVMPSRYEPCGLGQLIALRYGSLPVVRKTGGLADTIRDLDLDPSGGNGFVFEELDPRALLGALERASDHYRDERTWNGWVKRAMKEDFSWGRSALRYAEVYRKVMG